MKAKTFRGRSVQQAISRIKTEIGPEAVIMSTKRVPENRFDPYGKQIFEVTASLPEKKNLFSEKERIKKSKPSAFKKYMDIEESFSDINLLSDKKSKKIPDDIHKELDSIKDMLFNLQKNKGIPEYVFRFKGASSVYVKLIESGVSSELARKIILKSCSKEKNKKPDEESFRRRVFVDMMSMVESHNPFQYSKDLIAAAFIGPTGVGKTTTIAKIAADLVINENRKVGLISVDNYRVGALEQLKIYAGILGIPCMAAFDRKELEKAVSKMRSRDVILIDTAGISGFDEEKIKELKEILGQGLCVSTHLVLSVTSSKENLMESSIRFSELNPETYVFTKLDETTKRGVILDQLALMNLPVSFVTNGQKVPEDIEKGRKKTVLKKIFTDNIIHRSYS